MKKVSNGKKKDMYSTKAPTYDIIATNNKTTVTQDNKTGKTTTTQKCNENIQKNNVNSQRIEQQHRETLKDRNRKYSQQLIDQLRSKGLKDQNRT